MPEQRSIEVPEGLEGERVDAALGRLLGLSRTKAADLAEAGYVHLNGVQVGKSDRVTADAVLDIELPDPPVPEIIAPKIVEGLRCLLYTSPSPRDRQKSRMPSSA